MNTTSEMQLVQIDKLIPYVNNARPDALCGAAE